MRIACLVAALFSCASAPVATAVPYGDKIPKLICPASPTSYSAGSAFRVGPTLLVSAKHVTNFPHCFIDGREIHVTYTSPDKDFSLVTDDVAGPAYTVDCRGYIAGRKYLALGHARGLDHITEVELEATGVTLGAFYALKGVFTVIPGMSGGVIIDAETYKAVGIVNTYDAPEGLSGSIPLKDTPVC
jgi:hypothetical protein